MCVWISQEMYAFHCFFSVENNVTFGIIKTPGVALCRWPMSRRTTTTQYSGWRSPCVSSEVLEGDAAQRMKGLWRTLWTILPFLTSRYRFAGWLSEMHTCDTWYIAMHWISLNLFVCLFQTGNVSYALSLSLELLHHGNSILFKHMYLADCIIPNKSKLINTCFAPKQPYW